MAAHVDAQHEPAPAAPPAAEHGVLMLRWLLMGYGRQGDDAWGQQGMMRGARERFREARRRSGRLSVGG